MMTKLSYSLVLFAVAGAAYLTGSWRAPRESVSAAVALRPILYYRCPMHPDVRSDEPGTAPCCGMAFEPVYADRPGPEANASAASPAQILASPAQQHLIGVKTGTVAESGGTERLRAFGRVTPDENRVYRLTAGLEAYMTEIAAVTTGSRVRKDQWLGSFSTPEARLPIASFITAINVLEREQNLATPTAQGLAAATTSVTLATERLLTMGMSPVQLADIRRTRAATTTVRMTAPIDGFVLARRVATGQRFDAGVELFQIADLQRVWILADVALADADRLTPGTLARVTVGGRETPVRARVSQGLPQFDPAVQSFKLRLEIDDPGFVLRPDMFVDVEFEVPYPPALLVPADAVVLSGLGAHVFVERAPGVFEPREVQTGRRHGGRIAIVKGLQAGERIAFAGTFLLDSERRIQANDRPHH